MKELVVISGKGGTGKTSLVGSFAVLARNAVLADCDVDASDLHLVLQPNIVSQNDFYGMKKAHINEQICTQCGVCEDYCRFQGIKDYQVSPFSCEGCGVCLHICPAGAIEMVDHVSGQWFKGTTAFGPLVFARLGIGEENSGKLVSEVRKHSREIAGEENRSLIIIDGPPGVGCPVIATLSGVNLVLVVTEPTVSGLHDLKRVLKLADHFQVEAVVCINKWDLDEDKCHEIEAYCQELGVQVIGKIPFDDRITQAITFGVPPVKFASGGAIEAIKRIWEQLEQRLKM